MEPMMHNKRNRTGRNRLAVKLSILLIANAISAYAQISSMPARARSNDLGQCEIAFTDSQGAVLRADLASGSLDVVAQNQQLVQPLGICVGSSGEYFVTDTGCFAVLGVNP